MIAVRMLLKSCATPPASWPTACILVACATWRFSLASSLLSLSSSSTAASPSPRRPATVSATGSPGWRLRRTGKIARHRRAARIAPHRVGDRGLVFLDDEVAGIGRHVGPVDPGGDVERLVHRQEAAVAVDQRKPDRQDFEQAPGRWSNWRGCRFPAGRTSATVPAPPSPAGSSGTCTARSGARIVALGDKVEQAVVGGARRGRRSAAPRRPAPGGRSRGRRTACWRRAACRRRRPAPPARPPRRAARRSRRRRAWRRRVSRSGCAASGKRHSSRSPPLPARATSTSTRAAAEVDPRHARRCRRATPRRAASPSAAPPASSPIALDRRRRRRSARDRRWLIVTSCPSPSGQRAGSATRSSAPPTSA